MKNFNTLKTSIEKIKIQQNFPFVIAISGVARSGKNLFASILVEELNKLSILSVETSIAFQLRKEMSSLLKKKFNLNIWSQDTNEKNLFRPLMVAWANIRRQTTNGRYFIDHLKKRTASYPKLQCVVINDVRFKEFEYDETDFVKENGILCHITKLNLMPDGKYTPNPPPNETERINDSLVKNAANYVLEWPDFSVNCPDNQIKDYALSYVLTFLGWISNQCDNV